jgi:hypothetical protein
MKGGIEEGGSEVGGGGQSDNRGSRSIGLDRLGSREKKREREKELRGTTTLNLWLVE